MDHELKIGIIGVGNIVRTMHLPLLYSIPGVRVAYLADLVVDRAIARLFGAEPIAIEPNGNPDFPNADVVFVATPPGARSRYVPSLLKAGTAVLTEKPFAPSLEQHKLFLAAGNRVACNYNRRWYGNIRALKEMINSRLLGRLREVVIEESAMPRGTGKPSDHYQFDRTQSGGGILMERGCHTLSQLDWIFDDYQIVVASVTIECVADLDVDVAMRLHVSRDVEEGIDVKYTLSAGRLGETTSKYRFDNGIVLFDHTDAESRLRLVDSNGIQFELAHDPGSVQSSTQSFYKSWSVFLDKVRGKDQFDPGSDTSLRTTQIVAQAYEWAHPK